MERPTMMVLPFSGNPEDDVEAIFREHRRLLNCDEFDLMKEAGIFGEDERIELVDGQMLILHPADGRQLVATDGRRIRAINRIVSTVAQFENSELDCSVQNQLRSGDNIEFLPDVAILRPSLYSNAVPTTAEALMVIEVTDRSFNYHRAVKMPRYAAAGIPEMILVDLVDERLIGYADPRPDGYRRILVAGRGEQLPSATLPGLTFDVDRILGPQEK